MLAIIFAGIKPPLWATRQFGRFISLVISLTKPRFLQSARFCQWRTEYTAGNIEARRSAKASSVAKWNKGNGGEIPVRLRFRFPARLINRTPNIKLPAGEGIAEHATAKSLETRVGFHCLVTHDTPCRTWRQTRIRNRGKHKQRVRAAFPIRDRVGARVHRVLLRRRIPMFPPLLSHFWTVTGTTFYEEYISIPENYNFYI